MLGDFWPMKIQASVPFVLEWYGSGLGMAWIDWLIMSAVFYLVTAIMGPVGCAAEAAARVEARVRQDQDTVGWVRPGIEGVGLSHHTFASKLVNGPVSYLLYRPPDYEQAAQHRYPVVYWLHGVAAGQASMARFAARLDTAIRAGKTPPMIVVFVNGLRGSMYCDSADNAVPVESVIIDELIPHVDEGYRSIARREGRIIEGFSMGGFGATHLGFKYPDRFGAVSCIAGALYTGDSLSNGPRAIDKAIFASVFGNDKDRFEAQSPWNLVEKNVQQIRGRMLVRIVVGDRDRLLARNREYHLLLDRLGVAHGFRIVAGVGHSPSAVYDALADANWSFYRAAAQQAAAPAGQLPQTEGP